MGAAGALGTHLSRQPLINSDHAPGHVGAGRGRSPPISRRISANSVLGTAASALGDDPARCRPGPRLIAEAGESAPNVRRYFRADAAFAMPNWR
jgi:hypothetical protein